ncbi:MAG: hypothetical protein RIQ79_834 [Verrucomicrobiota bacterium]|jgi:hypothetical protein
MHLCCLIPTKRRAGLWQALLLGFIFLASRGLAAQVELASPETARGYVAHLLINETAFPGEKFWTSEEDTCAAQAAIIWVLRHRLRNIPPGYTQRQIAAVTTDNVIDLLTAGGDENRQVEGFYRDASGRPAMAARVTERITYLLTVANRGTPGRFVRLLNNAQRLADDFVGYSPVDLFAGLREIDEIPVTGGAYGWMTDREIFHPGGNFVRIGDRWRGGLGGNRFFTLRQITP